MGLFSNKKPTDSVDKVKETLEKFGLNIDEYDVEEIKKRNSFNIKKIAKDLLVSQWFKTGLALSFAKAEEQAKVTLLSAITEQNWILIRQNEIIIKELQKLNEK